MTALNNQILLNPKQHEFLSKIRERKYEAAGVTAGRGFGKSNLIGHLTNMLKEELPRAKGGLGGITLKQIKTVTLPEVKQVWKDVYGLKEYNAKTGRGDFIMFKEPPAHFDRPYKEPEDWDKCITFINGFCIEIEGFKLTSLENRGKNHDFYIIDEFAFFKEEWLKIVLPTIRANVGKFESKLHHIFAFFTSPPLSSKGYHVWKYEELAKNFPSEYLFIQGKTKDNQMFLPDNYISMLKKSLSKFEYDVEVEGIKISKNEKIFYTGLRDVHYYFAEEGEEPFHDVNKPLIASVDLNANFTCASMWQQPQHHEHRCIGNVFVREVEPGKSMAETLAIAIAKKYSHQKNRKIIITGDRNGNNKSAGSNKTMFVQIIDELKLLGFIAELDPITYNPQHKDKYILINDILNESGKSEHIFRFDAEEAKSTLVSMENAPMEGDYEKNKDSEKKGDQERATHLSDTVDYYAIWVVKGGSSSNEDDFEIEFF